MRASYNAICSLKSEEELSAYISSELEKTGADVLASSDYRCFGLRRENGDTATFYNSSAIRAGQSARMRDRYLVIGTRLQASNAAGLALFLHLAEKLSQERIQTGHSLLFAAFGGADDSHAGSWYFLNRAFSDRANIDAYVGLDLFDNPNKGFYAYTGSNADLNRLIARQSETMQPARPAIVAAEPAVADHRSFQAAEIPSVLFTTAAPGKPYFGRIDSMEFEELCRQCEYLCNFVLALDAAPAPSYYPREMSEIPVVSYEGCDAKPSFLGVSNPSYFLAKWVYTYLRYPDFARESGIQGRVLVEFEIDEKGHVGSVKAVKGPHSSLEDEAVRVIAASPDWKPGLVNGKPVRTQMALWVDFKLQKKNKKK